MKKIIFLIAATALLCAAVSCSDDEPKRGDGVFVVNTFMINHMVNTSNGSVIGIGSTNNKLTLDTVKHIASIELQYNNGSIQTASLSDVKALPKRLGFYELSSSGNAQIKEFKGYVDFNEGSMRYVYTTTDGIRVISTNTEVFFLKTQNIITYDDTTKATSMDNVMYQFNIMPSQQAAIVKVMDIVHAKHLRRLDNITSAAILFTVTPNGYQFSGQNISTSASYRSWTDSTGTATPKVTDEYPFKTFNATVDLVNDSLIINYMMGSSATVAAKGCTYPDYTAY